MIDPDAVQNKAPGEASNPKHRSHATGRAASSGRRDPPLAGQAPRSLAQSDSDLGREASRQQIVDDVVEQLPRSPPTSSVIGCFTHPSALGYISPKSSEDQLHRRSVNQRPDPIRRQEPIPSSHSSCFYQSGFRSVIDTALTCSKGARDVIVRLRIYHAAAGVIDS